MRITKENQKKQERGLIQKCIEKIKFLFSNPSGFFESVKNDSIENSLIYLILISTVPIIFIFFSILLLYSSKFALTIFISLLPSLLIVVGIVFSISFFVGIVFTTVLNALFLHIGVIIFGGKKPYEETFKVLVYALTPIIIFSPLLYIVIIFQILQFGFSAISSINYGLFIILTIPIYLYHIYLLVKGISILQEISTVRSILAVIVQYSIIFGILFLIFMLFKVLFSIFLTIFTLSGFLENVYNLLITV